MSLYCEYPGCGKVAMYADIKVQRTGVEVQNGEVKIIWRNADSPENLRCPEHEGETVNLDRVAAAEAIADIPRVGGPLSDTVAQVEAKAAAMATPPVEAAPAAPVSVEEAPSPAIVADAPLAVEPVTADDVDHSDPENRSF